VSNGNAYYFDTANGHEPRYIGYGLSLDESQAAGGGLAAVRVTGDDTRDDDSFEPARSEVLLPSALGVSGTADGPPMDYVWNDGGTLRVTEAVGLFNNAVVDGTLIPTIDMFVPRYADGTACPLDGLGVDGSDVGARMPE